MLTCNTLLSPPAELEAPEGTDNPEHIYAQTFSQSLRQNPSKVLATPRPKAPRGLRPRRGQNARQHSPLGR